MLISESLANTHRLSREMSKGSSKAGFLFLQIRYRKQAFRALGQERVGDPIY